MHFEPIKWELKLQISSKQNKHGGRAKQSKNYLILIYSRTGQWNGNLVIPQFLKYSKWMKY
jgi:hypothetical protein